MRRPKKVGNHSIGYVIISAMQVESDKEEGDGDGVVVVAAMMMMVPSAYFRRHTKISNK